LLHHLWSVSVEKQRAILADYGVFREMVANGGRFVDIAAKAGTMLYRANK
jgi:hypothetical protein